MVGGEEAEIGIKIEMRNIPIICCLAVFYPVP